MRGFIFALLAKVSHSNRSPEPCGATGCGTHHHLEGVSHINPRENIFLLGLAWDTLAGKKISADLFGGMGCLYLLCSAKYFLNLDLI
jgi:hypothetical protein